MRATIIDIARETGLAPGTVSRALATQGKYPVSEATRNKVQEAATKLGYRPNLIGRALAAGSSKLVSLISLSPFSDYYTQVARQLATCAARDGYCLVNNLAFDPEATPEFGEMHSQLPPQDWLYGVDGIIVCDAGPWQVEYIEKALAFQIPVVELGEHPSHGADLVRLNLADPAEELIRHLIREGNRSITMISDEGSYQQTRGQAYRRAMEEAGLKERVRYVLQQNRRDGRRAVQEELREVGVPDAFFCVNDAVAIGCCRGIYDQGLRIPEDVRVAGCDEIEDVEYLHCPLTTLTLPLESVCSRAWDFLKSRMEGYAGSQRVEVFPAVVTYRKSTQMTLPSV